MIRKVKTFIRNKKRQQDQVLAQKLIVSYLSTVNKPSRFKCK